MARAWSDAGRFYVGVSPADFQVPDEDGLVDWLECGVEAMESDQDLMLIVAERDGEVIGWAGVVPYSEREAYAGIGEFAVYVDAGARRSGAGRALMEALAAHARGRGLHKLVSKVFTTNEASRSLLAACGFREIGVHERHAMLDGAWRDVVVVERLLGEAADGS